MRIDHEVSRRSFLRIMTLGVAAGTGATLLAACGAPAPAAAPTTAPVAAPTTTPVAAPTTAPAAAPTAAPTAVAAAKPTTAAAAASAANFDWQKYKGSKVRMILNKHPFTESLIP